MHPFISIFGHRFMSYDLIHILAFVMVSAYFYHSLMAIPIKKYQVITYLIINIFVNFFGGMLLPFLYRWIYLQQDPWLNVLSRQPGRYFHSVFLTTLVYTLVVCRIWRWPRKKVLDLFIFGFFLGSAFSRIGCLLQGCCKGKPCNLPWAIHLPPNLEIARHPTQLYMILLEFSLVFFLWKYSKRKGRDGELFWISLLMYSFYRLMIEFVRVNPIAYFGLTHAQLFSAFAIILSSVMLLRQRDKISDGRKI